MSSYNVAIVGAGRMGAGIAVVAATAGCNVRLHDRTDELIAAALDGIKADLATQVERRRIAESAAAAIIERIQAAKNIGDLAGSDLVIEAIIEDFKVKNALFASVEAVVRSDAIIVTNTSSLSVTALGAVLKYPGRFAGFHFFNPPQRMKLVEVVAGTQSDPAVIGQLVDRARGWGKLPVVCQSTPGFIANRVARPFYGEALRLLEDRIADAATLDAVMRDCGGFAMGPCELMDLIGHDVNLAVTQSVYDGFFQDPRFRPSVVQRGLVEAGRLGRKSGHGFFDYRPNAAKPNPATLGVGTPPGTVVIAGDLGPAAGLVERMKAAGCAVEPRPGAGAILLGDCKLVLADGRTAIERSVCDGQNTIQFDLAFDYGNARRICVAFPDTCGGEDRARVAGLFQSLGMAVSEIADSPGMIVLRTVAMLVNEAADACQKGVASAADIDTAAINGLNYPIGPLAWGDRIGPGLVATAVGHFAAAWPDGRYRVSQYLCRRALAGGSLVGDGG